MKTFFIITSCAIALVISIFLFLLWPGEFNKNCWQHSATITACYDSGTIGLWPFQEKVCHLYFSTPGYKTVGGKVDCKPKSEGGVIL